MNLVGDGCLLVNLVPKDCPSFQAAALLPDIGEQSNPGLRQFPSLAIFNFSVQTKLTPNPNQVYKPNAIALSQSQSQATRAAFVSFPRGILRSGFDAAFAGERGGRFFGPGASTRTRAANAGLVRRCERFAFVRQKVISRRCLFLHVFCLKRRGTLFLKNQGQQLLEHEVRSVKKQD